MPWDASPPPTSSGEVAIKARSSAPADVTTGRTASDKSDTAEADPFGGEDVPFEAVASDPPREAEPASSPAAEDWNETDFFPPASSSAGSASAEPTAVSEASSRPKQAVGSAEFADDVPTAESPSPPDDFAAADAPFSDEPAASTPGPDPVGGDEGFGPSPRGNGLDRELVAGNSRNKPAPGAFVAESGTIPVAARSSQPRREADFDAAPDETGDEPSRVYEVRKDDSFWTIAKNIYGDGRYYLALAKSNSDRIPKAKDLKPGMKILAPSPETLRQSYPKLVPATVEEIEAAAGFFISEDGYPAYRVGHDETLTHIAQNHLGRASRWIQIYELNKDTIKDVKKLKPGTTLRLPPDASRVRFVRDRD
jgi:nucleoid-associated protein YgaU